MYDYVLVIFWPHTAAKQNSENSSINMVNSQLLNSKCSFEDEDSCEKLALK